MNDNYVFSVTRKTKTGNPIYIGDFETQELAETAMLEHYKKTPKNGDFYYWISKDRLQEIQGTVYRRTTYFAKDSFHKRYTAAELKELAM